MAYINELYEWGGDTTQPYPTNYTWKSKKWLFPFKMSLGAARIIAEYEDRDDYWDELHARNQAIRRNNARISAGVLLGLIGDEELGDRELNGDILEDVPTVGDFSGDYNCTFKLYADGVLKLTKEVYVNKPFRLGDGFRGRSWAFQVEGNIIIKRIDLGGSIADIKALDTQEE